MRASQLTRRLASLLLATCVLFWTSESAAMEPGSKMVHLCHTPAHHAATKTAPVHHEGCCPSHSSSMHKCLLQVALKLAATHPECCSISAPPVRPFAVLVSSADSVSLQVGAAVVIAAEMNVARPARGGQESSPPFVKPVFDLKTDLRI
jgi:hypothetical protein